MSTPETPDPRSEQVETITLACYGVPNLAPHEEIIALAWERAQAAIQQVFAEYGEPVRVEQVR
jgi:hypothetical protein